MSDVFSILSVLERSDPENIALQISALKNRIQHLERKLMKTPPRCPRCGSKMEFTLEAEGGHEVQSSVGIFNEWEPHFVWFYRCLNCNYKTSQTSHRSETPERKRIRMEIEKSKRSLEQLSQSLERAKKRYEELKTELNKILSSLSREEREKIIKEIAIVHKNYVLISKHWDTWLPIEDIDGVALYMAWKEKKKLKS